MTESACGHDLTSGAPLGEPGRDDSLSLGTLQDEETEEVGGGLAGVEPEDPPPPTGPVSVPALLEGDPTTEQVGQLVEAGRVDGDGFDGCCPSRFALSNRITPLWKDGA